MPGQHRLDAAGEWTPDELLVDERFVAVHLANKGLFVFTACSHAGLINVLTHAAERFPSIPLFGVLGGFHLAGPTEAIIPETVDASRGKMQVANAHMAPSSRSNHLRLGASHSITIEQQPYLLTITCRSVASRERDLSTGHVGEARGGESTSTPVSPTFFRRVPGGRRTG